MTGQLKCASGTAAAPGMTFSSDLDTGFYRASSDTIGVAAGGTQVGSIDSTGFKPLSGSYDKFPSGTLMLFQQTNAPSGWTKQTSHNDKALRVVSGTASSGGSTAFTSVFAARTLLRSDLPNVSVTTDSGNLSLVFSADYTNVNNSAATAPRVNNLAGDNSLANDYPLSGTSHTHSFNLNGGVSQTNLDFAVQYVDLIIAQKD